MNEKPEALRLADALDERVVPRWVHRTGDTPHQSGYKKDAECEQAAAELRRLHELNVDKTEIIAAISAQRDALLEACRTLVLRLAVEQARAAIKAVEDGK